MFPMHYAIPNRFSLLNFLVLSVVLTLIFTGCATTTEPDFVEVRPRSLQTGDELQIPLGNKILSLSGGTLGDKQIDADIPLLQSLGIVKYSVNDPYEKADIEYEGVLLETLFDQFGGAESTTMTITASDDYRQTISRVDAEKWPIMLALKADGNYAPSDHRGPSMIVYPYDQYPELEPTAYDHLWVWQITSIAFS
jgi:hypothetical protein